MKTAREIVRSGQSWNLPEGRSKSRYYIIRRKSGQDIAAELYYSAHIAAYEPSSPYGVAVYQEQLGGGKAKRIFAKGCMTWQEARDYVSQLKEDYRE